MFTGAIEYIYILYVKAYLTLGGKKNKLTRANFERFGEDLGLNAKQIEGVFKRFAKNKEKAIHWIDQSFLSDVMKAAYLETLEVKYQRLMIF